MINKDRIVPVTKTDLISLYSVILQLTMGADTPLTPLNAENAEGDFSLKEAGKYLATEPVKTLDVGASLKQTIVIIVPAYSFEGITMDGAPVTPHEGSSEIEPDGCSLYMIEINNGVVAVSKVGA